ncbi:MAG: penicillin-binding transpeptidase domain-containing protein, partial [Ilumatobacteraceae bacterium]
FGNNAYGLQAAAEVYYGKNVEDLTMIEGAFLAGLVRSPSGYDPIRKPERSRARFKQVTTRLVDVGLISAAQGDDLAANYVLPDRVHGIPTADTTLTYYSVALREYLLQKANFLGPDEQSRANLLYRGGLRIHTTLDPALQASAEAAQAVMPANSAGITSAIVSLDTSTGAIRAMVGGKGFTRDNQTNMALAPRQTGSSIKLFILSAALQAGAQPTDLIDGRRGCVLPTGDPKKPFIINGGEAGSIAPLNQQTWLSINCAFARLTQIVGLNRMVDTVYRMAHSDYLYAGQPTSQREKLQPVASFATGANVMSPLDMAAGMQSIANQGLHHDPYYVESIDLVDGSRLYTHTDPGTQVLDSGVALTALDVMKGVLTRGTARSALSTFKRPAAGKTGTQQDNSNAWFVGTTPQLTTAVWVGDPDSYLPMVNIPEFRKDGVSNVQGGTYPARIWRAYMQGQPESLPVLDWPPPPKPSRGPMRLYLPGVECLTQLVGGTAPTTTTSGVNPVSPLLAAPTTEVPTATTTATTTPSEPSGTTTTVPLVTTPPTPPPPVYRNLPSGTTIPPDVLDPNAPVPTVPLSVIVYTCGKSPGS